MSEQAAIVNSSPAKDENENKDTPVRVKCEIFKKI
jgi:hypothetical protein